ncbi:hypothetical protein [Epilithonimonas caeni]|uniref:hypothetical protein n=1 Tax=Epilithonimonas caeni TaxID=365343 RepID=UPI000486F3FA|nr:hypothetical protein [Epilithonimonas caeni]
MIKKLFITQSIFFYIVASSQVLTYVGNAAHVTIQPQTLLYNGGGLQTEGTAIVDNSGNVMVNGVSSDLLSLATTSNFNLKLATTSSYGQLYITGIPQGQISGKVNKEYLADYQNGSTGSQQIGLPFYNFSIQELVSVFGEGNLNVTNIANNSSGRFNPSSTFWWNNARARFDQIAYGGTAYYANGNPNLSFISPMTYYILPRRKSDATYFWEFPKTEKKIFKGTPASDVIASGVNNVNFALSGGYSGSFGTNGNASNTFGEKYYSYLDDPFRVRGTSWPADYAKNLYQLANPFLTNIDLKYIGIDSETGSDDNFISNLEGVAYYGDNNLNWTAQNGTLYPGTTMVVKVSGGAFQAGDVGANKLIIKPMGAFMVKMSSNAAQTLNLTKTRRFKQTSRADGIDYSVTAAKTSETVDDIPSDKIVKQVAVIMYDLDGLELDRTYYAVSPSAFTGYSPTATTLQAYSDNKKIYTKEEKLAGGEDATYTDKLYINEANEITFKTKEIPLYINYTDQPYQLKFELYEKGERVEDGLSNGNSFYIKDAQNQIIKIVDGGSLPSMNGAQTLGLYYEKPSNATLGTDVFAGSQTIIAKKDAQWVVRFAKDWKNATVEVYSSAGQLLNKQQNISTSYDYVVPLNYQAKSTFVIKAVSENGEVVIKKILN